MTDASIKAISVDGPGPINASPTIAVTAEAVELTNGAYITADTQGTAPAGDITFNVGTMTTRAGVNRVPLNPNDNDIVAGNLIASDSWSLNSDAGPAGNITIQGIDGQGTAATSVLLRDSSMSSRIFGGSPGASRSLITISADSLVLTNEGLPGGGAAATIVANTIGPAPAGNMAFNVNTLLGNVNSDETPIEGARTVFIVTSNNPGSTAGPTGTIQSPTAQMAGRLVALPNNPLTATALLSQRCAALAHGGQFSSFVMAGRYGVPPEPGGWLASPLMLDGTASGPVAQDGHPSFGNDQSGSFSGREILSIRRWPVAGTTTRFASIGWTGDCGS